MDISWSYYLIALLYALLVFLRLINNMKEDKYISQNHECKEVFTIKIDFFVTVAVCCTIVMVLINIAAIIGGKGINVQSIIVALLVSGLMLLNSFSHILFCEESKTFFYSGYVMKKEDLNTASIKKGSKRFMITFNFSREIESYTNAKILVYGKERRHFSKLVEKMTNKF